MPSVSRSRRSASRPATQRTRARRAATRRSPARSPMPDALRMLKDDHDKVKALFNRFERSNGSSKERIAQTICAELTLHAKLEEDVFYPAVRQATDDDDMMNEAEIEHATAKDLIAQIQGSSPDDERFDALVTVLSEYIKHHVREEEGEMFKKVRRSRLDTRALGEQMLDHKQLLKEQLERESRGNSA